MTTRTHTLSRVVLLLGSAAVIAVLPIRGDWNGNVPSFVSNAAVAKSGDNSGSGSSGSGSSGSGNSGSSNSGSGSSGSGDSDDDDSDDDSDRDSNDDNSNDDRGNRDSNDDRGGAVNNGGAAGTVVKFEVNGNDIEVVFADGTKEEITAGRYERKNAAGRTVEERPATQADISRLSALR